MNNDAVPSLRQFLIAFAGVFYGLGRLIQMEEDDELINELDAYRRVREKYDGDTSIYDSIIRTQLQSNTELVDMVRDFPDRKEEIHDEHYEFFKAFADAHILIGRFVSTEKDSYFDDTRIEAVRQALLEYTNKRGTYSGDPRLFNDNLNYTLEDFPDLNEVPRV